MPHVPEPFWVCRVRFFGMWAEGRDFRDNLVIELVPTATSGDTLSPEARTISLRDSPNVEDLCLIVPMVRTCALMDQHAAQMIYILVHRLRTCDESSHVQCHGKCNRLL